MLYETIRHQLTALNPVLKIRSLLHSHKTRESFTPWWPLVDYNKYMHWKYMHFTQCNTTHQIVAK